MNDYIKNLTLILVAIKNKTVAKRILRLDCCCRLVITKTKIVPIILITFMIKYFLKKLSFNSPADKELISTES